MSFEGFEYGLSNNSTVCLLLHLACPKLSIQTIQYINTIKNKLEKIDAILFYKNNYIKQKNYIKKNRPPCWINIIRTQIKCLYPYFIFHECRKIEPLKKVKTIGRWEIGQSPSRYNNTCDVYQKNKSVTNIKHKYISGVILLNIIHKWINTTDKKNNLILHLFETYHKLRNQAERFSNLIAPDHPEFLPTNMLYQMSIRFGIRSENPFSDQLNIYLLDMQINIKLSDLKQIKSSNANLIILNN